MTDIPDEAEPADDIARLEKSDTAFRTISEVSTDLHVPQHVLRFWESRFSQIKPLKRGGGRRYYRPEDVAILKRIKELLYTDGMTIKGVQKLLREGPSTDRAPNSAAVEKQSVADGLLDRGELERMMSDLTALRDDLRAALKVSTAA
jgi:DNA-binding transcriptional MerR regulator